ncbi:helix-turn-helix transcriptional regulator [Meridianimarinicoccus sp. MJW13]|uniref:helix-turn-helix domain-containing protein n=1 Tax=Meridianimarinicoccus sp. MJW13 TaxID=2720031 RepID=UPI001D008FA9|nr:helix-turn-helix transcriptional regulator [Fluviibacterium sp. MJW13]
MTDQETTDMSGAENPEEWFSSETSTFGDRLAGAREAAGMSRGQLARRLGVKETTVAKWEDDFSEPRANKLQMLSGILGVSLTWLLTAEGEGLDGPAVEDTISDDLAAILTEMRVLKSEMQRSADRVGLLEKRLRQVLKEDK